MIWVCLLLLALVSLVAQCGSLWSALWILRFKSIRWQTVVSTSVVVSFSGVSVGGIALGLLYFAVIDESLASLLIILLSLLAIALTVKLLKWQLETKTRWAICALVLANIIALIPTFVLTTTFKMFVAETFVVPTNAMAPTIMGKHANILCVDGATVEVSASHVIQQGRYVDSEINVICPCEETPSTALVPADILEGDRIFVNKLDRTPVRWGLFVFNVENNIKYIKRMIGLPGETVTIKRGEVYIDGALAQKPVDLHDQLWWPVSVLNQRPTALQDCRSWVAAEENSAWKQEQGVWQVKATDTETLSFSGVITDRWCFNERRRSLGGPKPFDVDDLCIDFTVDQFTGEGTFAYQADYRGHKLWWEFSATGDIVFRWKKIIEPESGEDDEEETSKTAKATPFAGSTLSIVLRDGRSYVLQDGELIAESTELFAGNNLSMQDQSDSDSSNPGQSVFSLTAENAEISIRDISVQRDVYYLSMTQMEANGAIGFTHSSDGETWNLSDEQFFYLGDNSRSSLDSRFLDVQRPTSAIVGRLRNIYWPSERWRSF
ncbi:MAG: hypothetical protein COA78_26085 [Blastopirellula sp.]|nr:MAG: hypothetical protein COA78_26085 [Blastopirellula sp.]